MLQNKVVFAQTFLKMRRPNPADHLRHSFNLHAHSKKHASRAVGYLDIR